MNGIVMVVAVLRDLIFAYRFGTGAIVDAFLMGLLVPTMAVQVVGASFSSAIVPEIIRLRVGPRRDIADALASTTGLIGIGLLLLLTVILLLLRSPLTTVLTAGFDAERTRLTSFFFIGFLPCIVVQGWSTFLGGLLNSSHRFALVALVPILRPLALCVVLAVDWGAASTVILLSAYLVGAIAEAALLTVLAACSNQTFRPRWLGLTSSVRTVLREFVMSVVGSGILSLAILADQYFASLTGPGGVAAYGYGGKIIGVLIGMGALPLGVAILPHFSTLVREGQWEQLRRVLVQWTALVLALSILTTALCWFYSYDLTRILFQRGAFSAEDSRLVSTIQMYLVLQLPFYLCGILYVRALTSLQSNGLLAAVALINAAINIGGSVLLIGSLGVTGIAVAASCGYAVASTLAAWFVVFAIRRAEKREGARLNDTTCDATVTS